MSMPPRSRSEPSDSFVGDPSSRFTGVAIDSGRGRDSREGVNRNLLRRSRKSGMRRGDLVEVRSPSEILATLDSNGTLDGLPFMPEMLDQIGKRYRVTSRVERACDTIEYRGSRRMPNTVMLDDLRCDGQGHDGCQAACRIYWREAWLRRVNDDEPHLSQSDDEAVFKRLEELVTAGSRDRTAPERYRCQATDFIRASHQLPYWAPRSLVRELTCGNVGLVRFLRVVTRLVLEEVGSRLRLRSRYMAVKHPSSAGTEARLGLRPGERVRVRPRSAIMRTLDANKKARGLFFDREMVPYCGTQRVVKFQVEALHRRAKRIDGRVEERLFRARRRRLLRLSKPRAMVLSESHLPVVARVLARSSRDAGSFHRAERLSTQAPTRIG